MVDVLWPLGSASSVFWVPELARRLNSLDRMPHWSSCAATKTLTVFLLVQVTFLAVFLWHQESNVLLGVFIIYQILPFLTFIHIPQVMVSVGQGRSKHLCIQFMVKNAPKCLVLEQQQDSVGGFDKWKHAQKSILMSFPFQYKIPQTPAGGSEQQFEIQMLQKGSIISITETKRILHSSRS